MSPARATHYRQWSLQPLCDGCGYTMLGPGSGTVTSKNYPGTYPNHTWCEWQIQMSPGNNILLKFGDFDLQQCASDYLRIFKGISHSMTEYGPPLPLPYLNLPDSNEMTIQFKSGSHISGRGFLISYSTSNHPDLITCLDKGNHYDEPRYSKYCPAGCKTVIGDVSGDAAKGYRHVNSWQRSCDLLHYSCYSCDAQTNLLVLFLQRQDFHVLIYKMSEFVFY
uniref:CUB domain-containing protein n=1 Tax=Callorhinchus milii TaxID=7868 RepID=A0A4W3HB00_CALMI